MTAFYVLPSSLPNPRFFYGLREGSTFYDALAIGEPFNQSGTFTLTRLGPTSWRVTFASPVYNYPPLGLKECYVFSPALTVRQVTRALNGNGHVTSVDLETFEQSPTTYTLTVYGSEVVN